jgi:hypothetical protein
LVTPRIGTGTPTTAMNILNAAREAGALRHTARRTYWQDPLVVRRNTKRWRLTHKEECNTATAAEVASSITLRLKTGAGGQRATATGLLGAPCDG